MHLPAPHVPVRDAAGEAQEQATVAGTGGSYLPAVGVGIRARLASRTAAPPNNSTFRFRNPLSSLARRDRRTTSPGGPAQREKRQRAHPARQNLKKRLRPGGVLCWAVW
eukprot:gene11100-biopygen7825